MKSIRKAQKKRPRSSIEILVYSWLEEDNIKFKQESPIGRCHVDILFPPKTVIEINGCYWHGCSSCNKQLTASHKKTKVKDARRYSFFISQGYDVHVIWEHEINDEPERVRSLLRSLAEKAGK